MSYVHRATRSIQGALRAVADPCVLFPETCLTGTPGPIRTGDQLLRRQLLYPLSYGRWHQSGAGDEVRTRDIQLGRLTLYQLSYTRMDTGSG